MNNKLKFLLIILLTILFILYLYIIIGISYNILNYKNTKIEFSEIEKRYAIRTKERKEISKTKTFRRIFSNVFNSNIKCIFNKKYCLNNKKILLIIENDIEDLNNELNNTYDYNNLRSTTLLFLKDIYKENSFDVNYNIETLDILFTKDNLNTACYIIMIVLLLVIIISEMSWLKYSGIFLMVSSLLTFISLYLIKILSYILAVHNEKICASITLNKMVLLPIKYCMYFAIIGLIQLLIYYVYKIVTINKKK